MPQVITDPAGRLKFYFRKARTSVPKTLTFLNEDDTPYDLSAITFKINFIDPDTNEVELELTEGDGITKVDNTLTFGLTAEQSDVSKDLYWWELLDDTNTRSWIYDNAYCIVNLPTEEDEGTGDVTVRLTGETITITISNGVGAGLSTVDGGTL